MPPPARGWSTHVTILVVLLAIGGGLALFESRRSGGGFINLRYLATYTYFCGLAGYAALSTALIFLFGRGHSALLLHGGLMSLLVLVGGGWMAYANYASERSFAPHPNLANAVKILSWRVEESPEGPAIVADLETNFEGELMLNSFRGRGAGGAVLLSLEASSLTPARQVVHATPGARVKFRQPILRVAEGRPTEFQLFFGLSRGDWRNEVWYLPDEPEGLRRGPPPATWVHRTPPPVSVDAPEPAPPAPKPVARPDQAEPSPRATPPGPPPERKPRVARNTSTSKA